MTIHGGQRYNANKAARSRENLKMLCQPEKYWTVPPAQWTIWVSAGRGFLFTRCYVEVYETQPISTGLKVLEVIWILGEKMLSFRGIETLREVHARKVSLSVARRAPHVGACNGKAAVFLVGAERRRIRKRRDPFL